MDKLNVAIALALVALVIAIGGYFYPHGDSKFGQIVDTFTGDNFNVLTANGGGAFQVNGTSILTGTSLNLTTTNTATSTLSSGCYQTYATSTATPVRLLFTPASATTTISGTAFGAVAYGFGSCPF